MSLAQAWYGPRWRLCWLWPLHLLMRVLVAVRRTLYRWRWLRSHSVGLPVIVVGNITVGGTGKTPFVLWLVEYLQRQGWKPGIVSRGYGGNSSRYPCIVSHASVASEVGDEPLLLHRSSSVPVVVDPTRPRAAAKLKELGCDIVISDDGLQHYSLVRDIEIVVVDAVRQLGNGWLMPAGPLRELPSRLREIDFCVANGAAIPGLADNWMELKPGACVSVSGEQSAIELAAFAGQRIHAVAGIGNPERFFSLLRAAGLIVEAHPFADHHDYCESDVAWRDAPILMTEKDAVKCQVFARENMWYLPVRAQLDPAFIDQLAIRLDTLSSHRSEGKTHG